MRTQTQARPPGQIASLVGPRQNCYYQLSMKRTMVTALIPRLSRQNVLCHGAQAQTSPTSHASTALFSCDDALQAIKHEPPPWGGGGVNSLFQLMKKTHATIKVCTPLFFSEVS